MFHSRCHVYILLVALLQQWALNERTLAAITSHRRNSCDTASLCNATIFTSSSSDSNGNSNGGEKSVVYFAFWDFPPSERPPNLTIADCNSAAAVDSCTTSSSSSSTRSDRDVICHVDERGWRNSLPMLEHFPHAAELLLPCWNYFTQCSTARYIPSEYERELQQQHQQQSVAAATTQHVNLIDESNLKSKSKDSLFLVTSLSIPVAHLLKKTHWMQSMLEVMGVNVYYQPHYIGNRSISGASSSGAKSCAVTYIKGDRFINNISSISSTSTISSSVEMNNWGVGEEAISKLRSAFQIKKLPESNSILRIGVLNRKGRRQIDNGRALIDELNAAVQQARSSGSSSSSGSGSNSSNIYRTHHRIVAEQVTMDSKTLQQQIQWISDQHVILAPHGAQNTNFAFIRRCTAVIEAYPAEFFIPQYYMPLVTMVGGIGFVLVDLPPQEQQQQQQQQQSDSSSSDGPAVSPYAATARLVGIEERRRARSPHLQLDVAVLVQEVLPRAIDAHLQCLRKQQQK